MSTPKPVYLCIDRDGWTGGLQISIDSDGTGCRITGPKYNGSSVSMKKHKLTERDAQEIRRYLDKAFPVEAKS